jgi:hypothetical protein
VGDVGVEGGGADRVAGGGVVASLAGGVGAYSVVGAGAPVGDDIVRPTSPPSGGGAEWVPHSRGWRRDPL